MKSINRKLLGATLSAAVAMAFVAPVSADQSTPGANAAWVKCAGINSCRGQSMCKLTTNECRVLNNCKGQNSCKGKGWTWKTPENCKRAGGTAPENPAAMK